MDVDLSIPEGAPPELVSKLTALIEELEEGDITAKGYRKHRENILSGWLENSSMTETASVAPTPSVYSKHRQSSIISYPVSETRTVGQERTPDSPTLEFLASLPPLQPPLPRRGIPDTVRHDPLNKNVRLTKFDNLPSILRHRAKTNVEITAFTVFGEKGKELQSITWGRLLSRSERVAQELREKSGLFRGDRVTLVYYENEHIEFIVALMGCFLAGLVAVPFGPEYLAALPKVLQSTQCHLLLTSESTWKHIKAKSSVVSLTNVTWWRTSDWDRYKRGELPALQVPDLAYIDYSVSPLGEFRGVVLSHRTILHQMTCITAMSQSAGVLKGQTQLRPDKVLCSLDCRRSTGLIFAVLHSIYAGNSTYFISSRTMRIPGLYAYIISKYRMTVLLSDSSSLKSICYNYQDAPDSTRNYKKHFTIDLSSVRSCMIVANQVDAEFLMAFTDRWLTPLGNRRAREIVTPMLTLTEHGGMVIAMRDWLNLENDKDQGLLTRYFIDREALKQNRIVLMNTNNNIETLSIGPFGYPLPDSTLAIVDPETKILCQENEVGEIWIDSPSISGGFWGLAEDTENTFHAKCYDRDGKLDTDFLRTGLLGFVVNGQVCLMGLLEDRLVQRNIPEEVDTEGMIVANALPDLTYFYSPHLVYTIVTSVPKIKECCIFQVPLNDELLSYVIIETPVAKPLMFSGVKREVERDMTLDEMCTQVVSILKAVHNFTAYCVIATEINATPRIRRSGDLEIAKLLARKYVKNGILQSVHVKYNISNAVTHIPTGQDPQGGIWSPAISYIRADSLQDQDRQYSGVDMHNMVQDDRSATSLDKFPSLMHIFQWRLTRQPDELAYMSIFMRAQENNRETTWSKLDQQVAGVYYYLKDHLRATVGTPALLMYTHSEDFVVAVLACFLLGVTVIPINTLNTERLDEDIPSLVKLKKAFKCDLILGNHETHGIMEGKAVSSYLKHHHMALGKLHNTSKVKPKLGMTCKQFTMNPKTLEKDFPALVWINWTPDHDYIASQMSHTSILGMSKIQKVTCQMSSTKPIIGCVRSVLGIGFLYTCCLGIYVGASTLLVSPVDYANNPTSFFLTASRYKVKDAYATVQMLEHACKSLKPKGYSLSELMNLLIIVDGRADTDIVNNVRLVFGSTGLETLAINMAYGCIGNPVVTTRSYMRLEPIDLWLDPVALRQGYVVIVNPWNCPNALHLQDSGMVSINTQIAIVNPETHMLCKTGEFGEIWILSEGNQTKFYRASERTNNDVMAGTIDGGDPNVEYMRTGDFGFLHSVTKGEDELQVLFVLGSIALTVEINGLQHFTFDVETTVEKSHPRITSSVFFNIGSGMSVICVETPTPKDRLPALSSVVVNSILEYHEFVVDIVVFVDSGKIPKSRLGEKQRKTLIQAYIKGSLSITAQYGIKAQN